MSIRVRPKLPVSKAVYTIEKYLVNETDGTKIPVFKKVRNRPKEKILLDGYEYTYHPTRGWRKNKV